VGLHTDSSANNRQPARPDLGQRRGDTYHSNGSSKSAHQTEHGYLAPLRANTLAHQGSSISDTGSAPDSLLDLYGPASANRSAVNSMDYGQRDGSGENYADDDDPERSRWIHRDKLAQIESQELQAAGIILPSAKASRKASRSRSRDKLGNAQNRGDQQKRRRAGSIPLDRDLRLGEKQLDGKLPREGAEDQNSPYGSISKGSSRIPIAKTSPLPIGGERDTTAARRKSGNWTGDEPEISYAKARGRSHSVKLLDGPVATSTSTPTPARRVATENSPPKKSVNAQRKASLPNNRNGTAARPKTRSGNKSRETSGQRPTTRSGELTSPSNNKRPEGDPPWLATMYKPDPRLPPDQQLLPTVAKRLQQEQWEREGKFGTAYDTSFRPLNDEPFTTLKSEPSPETTEATDSQTDAANDTDNTKEDGVANKKDKVSPKINTQAWPLAEQPKSPNSPAPMSPKSPKTPTSPIARPSTASGGGGSYSTMPRIPTGKPQGVGPLPSPKTPQMALPVVRQPDLPDAEATTKKGCCIVM
jgi:hypothetical protein